MDASQHPFHLSKKKLIHQNLFLKSSCILFFHKSFSNIFPQCLTLNQSFIISSGKIESYNAEMVETNGVSIPIGRGYREIIENLYLT